MGIIARQSAKYILVSYIGIAIGAINTLWIFPYFLSSEIIGLYRIVLDIAIVIGTAAQFGVTQTVVKYYPHIKGYKKTIYSTYLIIMPLFSFLVIAIIGYIFKDPILSNYNNDLYDISQYFILIIVLAFFIMCNTIINSYCLSRLRIVVPNFLNNIFFKMSISVIVIGFGYSLITLYGFFVALILVYFIITLLLIVYVVIVLRANIKNINLQIGSIKSKLYFDMFKYSAFSFLGISGGIIISKVDILMVGGMINLSETGIYSIAFFIGSVIEIPQKPISGMVFSLSSKLWINNDTEGIRELYKKSAITQLILGGLIFIVIWVNIDFMFELMPKGYIFSKGKIVVFWIAIGKLIDLALGSNTAILTSSKSYKWNIYLLFFLSIISILANYFLIPKYGIAGAAFATLSSIALYNICRFFVLYAKFNLQPFNKANLLVILVIVFFVLVLQYVPIFNNVIVNIFIRSTLSLGYIVIILILKVSPDINDYFILTVDKIKSMLQNIIQKS